MCETSQVPRQLEEVAEKAKSMQRRRDDLCAEKQLLAKTSAERRAILEEEIRHYKSTKIPEIEQRLAECTATVKRDKEDLDKRMRAGVAEGIRLIGTNNDVRSLNSSSCSIIATTRMFAFFLPA